MFHLSPIPKAAEFLVIFETLKVPHVSTTSQQTSQIGK